jgi:hypothetical protein
MVYFVTLSAILMRFANRKIIYLMKADAVQHFTRVISSHLTLPWSGRLSIAFVKSVTQFEL